MKIGYTESKIMALYSMLAGIAYFIVAILEITGIDFRYISHDIFGGIALIVIATIYFAGIKETLKKSYRGYSFILGGIILSLIFGVMHLLIYIAGILEYAIGNSGFPFPRAEIILAISVSPLAYLVYKKAV